MKRLLIFSVSFILLLGVLSGGVTVSAVSCSAVASAVIYSDTGEIIYSNNADTRLPMASTTKIMTALLLCEYGNLDREIRVTEEMVRVEGSSMGLLPNDIVTLRGLLYGMLLPSGNDAANATAYVVAGSPERFSRLMNEKAALIGLKNTHFVTPSGLDAEEHYTTAYELALLAAEALRNDDFREASASESAVLYYGNPPYRRGLTNHNKLLGSYDGMIGVKTGFTKKAGRCLVTAAERDGNRIVAVTLNDRNDWEDHRELLDYGFSKLSTQKVTAKEKRVKIPVVSGKEKYAFADIPEVSVTTVGEKNLTYKIFKEDFLYAPVSKGQTVGRVCIYADNTILKSVEIRSAVSIGNRKVAKREKFKNIFFNILCAL